MPDDDGYLISEHDLRRITKVVRQSERANKSKLPARRRHLTPRLVGTPVRARNETGHGLEQGDLVNLYDWLLDEMDGTKFLFTLRDPVDVSYTNSQYPWGYGVVNEKIAGTANDWLIHVDGFCVAWVNVGDTEHRFARALNTGGYLLSSFAGPVEILSRPTSTGAQKCIVRLGPACAPIEVGVLTDAALPNGEADIYTYNGSTWSSTGRIVACVNPGFATMPIGQLVILSWNGVWADYIIVGKVT